MPQAKLQDLIEAHDQPFVVIDEQYRIVAANSRYCQAYGVALEDIVRRRCHEVSHHSPRPCHENGEDCPHQALFKAGQAAVVLHTHYHADGEPERTRIRGHAIRGDKGRLYLGEILYPLEVEVELGCEEMRMVGHSPAFLACVDKLARVADCEASVLLHGESGVGKELAARFVHDRSPRAAGPFIAINCAAVPESLFETELFGHEKGAFTGGNSQKKGLFEMADRGTLFLDEVAEIPPLLQAKLLRVLESGEFRRVGGTRPVKVDVRLVSATNRDLPARVDDKRFRQDLYYRLAGIEVALPPLRERREDIPALAEVLLERMARPGQAPCHLDRSAAQRLKRYDFPGNVRELRNLLQRAVVQCQGGLIRDADLGLDGDGQRSGIHSPPSAAPAPAGAPKTLADVERAHIQDLLERNQGHRRTVAALLGVTERTLYRKIKQYQLA
ncbi:MAG TPA: sigma 54-interacting transcriptional regulator [Thiobacillaceae bacterium]|nr:sigma 54-interacting transcriptional regulator [Thiobacillaceae bacterium]HNA80867.1 sigma 54-interacting transcriptional regulator [Thiobacillaceae bacterium]HNF88266.1 sigma 54-interacting transcriptional regulator [Thiobacillaceae bacterium]HNH88290.1 sigma 54-interacting transcriptional regulator [Thiobacillaceae bacterium]